MIRCMSENHVHFQKNPVHPMTLRSRRTADCTLQVPAHHKTGREKFFNPTSKAWRTQGRHRATDCISQVSRHGETGRMRFQKDFNLSKKDSLFNPRKDSLLDTPPDSHNVVVEQPTVEPKEKTPDDMRVSSEERVNRSSGSRDQTQASQLASTMFFFTQCWIVKFVNSRKLPEDRAGTVRKQEETVLIIHKILEMLQRRITRFSVKATNLVQSIVSQS